MALVAPIVEGDPPRPVPLGLLVEGEPVAGLREAARIYAASVMNEKFGSGKAGDLTSNMMEIEAERRAFVEAARNELGIPID